MPTRCRSFEASAADDRRVIERRMRTDGLASNAAGIGILRDDASFAFLEDRASGRRSLSRGSALCIVDSSLPRRLPSCSSRRSRPQHRQRPFPRVRPTRRTLSVQCESRTDMCRSIRSTARGATTTASARVIISTERTRPRPRSIAIEADRDASRSVRKRRSAHGPSSRCCRIPGECVRLKMSFASR